MAHSPPQTPDPESGAAEARAARRIPRWLVVVLALPAIGVGIRAALPEVLRSVGQSQASSALGTEVRIANIDLWLFSGVLAVEGVRVGNLDTPPPAADAETPRTTSPGVGIDRAYLRLRWRDLIGGRVGLDEAVIDGVTLRLRRSPDGDIELFPAMLADAAAKAEAAAAAPDAPREAPGAPETATASEALATPGTPAPPEASETPAAGEIPEASAAAEPSAPPETPATSEAPDEVTAGAENEKPEGEPGEPEASAIDAQVAGGWLVALDRLELNDVDVLLRDESFEEPREGAFALEQLAMTAVAFHGRRLDLGSIEIEGPTLHFPPALALPRGGGTAAPESEPEPPGEPFDFGVDELNIRRAGVFVVGDRPIDIAFHLVARRISGRPNELFPVKLDLSVEGDEGTRTLAIDGRLGLAPMAFDGRLEWSQLVLANLIAPFAEELAPWMDSGRSSGGLHVSLRMPAPGGDGSIPDGLRADGKIRIDDLALAHGGEKGEETSLAWSSLEIDVREFIVPLGEDAGPVEIDLARVALSDPAMRITLGGVPAAGDEPAEAVPDDAGAAEPEAADGAGAEPDADAGVRVKVAALELTGGNVTLLDRSVQPFYRGKLSELRISARDARWPESSVGELSVSTRMDDAATIALRGMLASEARDGEMRFELENLPLRPFNPYATRFTAYRISGGEASLYSDVRIIDSHYQTANSIELNDFDLTELAEGEFKKNYGVPLQLGLALLRDVGGDIALKVPLTLGDEGASVGVGTIIRGALQRAVASALTSPLKAVGMLIPKGESIDSLATTLPSPPGRAEISGGGDERIEALAKVLASRPALALLLRGSVGEADRPALARQELLARAEAGHDWPEVEGDGWLARRRVRDFLRAEASGEAKALRPDDALTLERWIAAVDVPATRNDDLAARRAAFVRDQLLTEHGFALHRIRLAAGAVAGEPGVIAELELGGMDARDAGESDAATATGDVAP